ncbi:MAG: histidinol-phosphate transaminase [Deltaproteobacteria bacterium]|nr:histidinol-phosphate transaminase [Deltaproteobacteria bacterium]
MFKHLVSENILNLNPYSPGKPIEELKREIGLPHIIKLASNENPLGPSPQAIRAILNELPRVSLYPEGSCHNLRKKLATYLNVSCEQLLFGNGSNEIIELLVRTFCLEKDEVMTADYAFIIYELVGRAHGCYIHRVPMKNYSYDLEGLAAAITDRTKLIFIANPNNPTGSYINGTDLTGFLRKTQNKNLLVVLDEAYFEYVHKSDYPNGIDLLKTFPHLVVLRTFSKIYGLAGFRIGYAIAHSDILSCMNRIKAPFNVNYLAQVAACAAIEDVTFIKKTLEIFKEGFSYLYSQLSKLGFVCHPSVGNFHFVDLRRQAAAIYEKLLKNGVIIRPLKPYGLDQHCRISVGTMEENQMLIAALKTIL